MKTFNDATGREWTLDVNITVLRRVRDLTGFDFLGGMTSESFSKFTDDFEQVVNVLYVMVQPAADAAKVSDIQFGESLDGTSVAAGLDALLAELLRFFPTGQKAIVLTLAAKAAKATTQQMTKAVAWIEAQDIEGKASKKMDDVLVKSSELLTAALASSASIPAGSPSVN